MSGSLSLGATVLSLILLHGVWKINIKKPLSGVLFSSCHNVDSLVI